MVLYEHSEHPYICWIINYILKFFDKLVLHILFYDTQFLYMLIFQFFDL